MPILSFTYPTTCSKQEWPFRPCIVTANVKYIPPLGDYEGPCSGALAYSIEEQLYLLDQDPGETDNKVSQMTELRNRISKRLHEGLEGAIQSSSPKESEDKNGGFRKDLRRQLEILGYIDEGTE